MSQLPEHLAHPRVTLDHNCIVALEENRADAANLRELLSMHEKGEVQIRVVGIGASEKRHDGTYASTFDEFKKKLASVGLQLAEILVPLARFNITYFDYCVLADETMEKLERDIHSVLFPNLEFEYVAYCATQHLEPESAWGSLQTQKWRNAKCDVLSMWCHIWYGGDIFVTTDRNFHKVTKKPQLIALEAGNILRPDEALQSLQSSGTSNSLEVRG